MRAVVAAEQVGPGRWVLPRLPESDPAALLRLADDCQELDAVLAGVVRDARWVLADLRHDWSGPAAVRAPAPLRQLEDDVAVVSHALDVLARELERLADALARAEDSHGWSWRKVAAVSAVVAVSAGAVVVTVGSAGTASPGAAAAETAVVSAAAGEMAAAAGAAASAEAAAAEGLLLVARLARSVETLRAIIVPRVVVSAMRAAVWVETPLGAAAVGAASTAAGELVTSRRVDPLDVAFAALLGAGETYVLSPGRSRGYLPISDRRLALMRHPYRRSQLIRIARERFPQSERPLGFPAKQMRTHHKHAKVFGHSTDYNRWTSAAFERSMRSFVAHPTTVRVDGRYKGKRAIMYTNYDSRIVVICRPNGDYWSAFRLRYTQWWHVWHDNALGGR